MKDTFSFLWETAKVVLIALIIVLPIRMFVFQPFLVKGDSMKPNFHNGDYLIIDELSYRFREPKRGEVIVFKFPGDLSQRYIKRIIGLPGETVDFQNNTLTISKGEEMISIHESYIPNSFETRGISRLTLQNEEYFMLGDNRMYSLDSRAWGILPKKDIIGKVFVRVFPPNAFAVVKEPAY